uniref:C1q domain-containing protein n=1 Tax=Magallana gigas TaxID=29159 RepID=A0A8W8M1Q8_MAGGI|nr:EMILIN-1-like [Crassostrea gigas]
MLGFAVLFSVMTSTGALYINTVQKFEYIRQGGNGPAVAFTALLSKHTTVSSHGVVKYDNVLTNVGGAYEPSTGIFTAPYRGIYTISCILMSHPSNYVHLRLTMNNKKLSIVYSGPKTHPHSGQTLQLLVNKGDKIWVQNENDQTAKLNDHGSYNVFSGVLIKKI